MAKVEVSIEDDGWNSLNFIKLIERACSVTLEQLGIDSRFQISVLGCSDGRIATLNSKFRNKEEVTNVLSWPAEERSVRKPGILPPKPKFLENQENQYYIFVFSNQNILNLVQEFNNIDNIHFKIYNDYGILFRLLRENLYFLSFVLRNDISLIYNFTGTRQLIFGIPTIVKIQNLLFFTKKLDSFYPTY